MKNPRTYQVFLSKQITAREKHIDVWMLQKLKLGQARARLEDSLGLPRRALESRHEQADFPGIRA